MYKNKRICVVVPAYNEDTLIRRVIETMPAFVDRIVIVDDCSTDRTIAVVEECIRTSTGEGARDSRIHLIRHDRNQGVGGAISTGYKYARDNEFDVAVVMAGDAQMAPDDLPALLDPVVEGTADYSKGNRLFTGQAWDRIPKVRYLGNAFLSLLTKVASGYWHIADSQTGYTAINLKMLRLVDWDRTYRRYGCPNDYLVRLNVYNARVCDVPVKPVYGVGEKSGIRLHRVVPRMSWLLLKLFVWRMKEKYVIRDFHPLVLFYMFGVGLMAAAVPLAARLVWRWITVGRIPPMNALACFFAVAVGLQSLLFAMWFDMESNKHLR